MKEARRKRNESHLKQFGNLTIVFDKDAMLVMFFEIENENREYLTSAIHKHLLPSRDDR
jgi:hypothetical protein